MKLIFSLTLIWILCSSAAALQCDACKDLTCSSTISKKCTTETMCITASIRAISSGSSGTQIFKDCADASLCPATGAATFSVNLGFSSMIASAECCNTNKCNTQTLAYPNTPPVNNLTCLFCDPINSQCSSRVQCTGDQNNCFQATLTNGSTTYTALGCTSSNICQGTGSLSTLPFMQNVGSITTAPSCCNTSSCNTIPPTTTTTSTITILMSTTTTTPTTTILTTTTPTMIIPTMTIPTITTTLTATTTTPTLITTTPTTTTTPPIITTTSTATTTPTTTTTTPTISTTTTTRTTTATTTTTTTLTTTTTTPTSTTTTPTSTTTTPTSTTTTLTTTTTAAGAVSTTTSDVQRVRIGLLLLLFELLLVLL